MNSIGRAFDRASSSIYSHLALTGEILPPDRTRFCFSLALIECAGISHERIVQSSGHLLLNMYNGTDLHIYEVAAVMNGKLIVGTKQSRTIAVDEDRTIDFMGEDCRVYATPSLVSDIEHTCRDLIVENVSEGQDSVGTIVSIAHTAPTLLGMTVTVTVTVTEIEGRKIEFVITAKDELDDICNGRHERFVVDVDKTQDRLRQKAAKLQGR